MGSIVAINFSFSFGQSHCRHNCFRFRVHVCWLVMFSCFYSKSFIISLLRLLTVTVSLLFYFYPSLTSHFFVNHSFPLTIIYLVSLFLLPHSLSLLLSLAPFLTLYIYIYIYSSLSNILFLSLSLYFLQSLFLSFSLNEFLSFSLLLYHSLIFYLSPPLFISLSHYIYIYIYIYENLHFLETLCLFMKIFICNTISL